MSEKKQTVKAELATLEKRIFSGLIDWAIMVVVIIILEIIPSIFYWVNLPLIGNILYALMSLIIIVLNFGYFVFWPLKKNGQTIGKKMQNIQIAIIDNPEKGTVRPVAAEDFTPLLFRWLLFIVDGLVCGLVGVFFILNSADKQRLGDQIAKTVVIVTNSKSPASKEPTKKTTTTASKEPAKKTTTTASKEPTKKTSTKK